MSRLRTTKGVRMELDLQEHQTLVIWAAACAERVLENFERAVPGDARPREAIEAGRAWARGELKMTGARKAAFASHAAARDAPDDAAKAAARAAGHAAATAHVYTHAPHAANYATTSVRKAAAPAANTAVTSLDTASVAIARERSWQREQIPEHLHQIVLQPCTP
ncbi:putative immunity protein [Rhodococcus marinonascens]|uniref:putative immunity protein n=1 Tax=Rhodococcus marinonascens TaxID=38311 RepID=UPI000AD89173|nr:hypothetical protein [Rhodococcus marinonascens]